MGGKLVVPETAYRQDEEGKRRVISAFRSSASAFTTGHFCRGDVIKHKMAQKKTKKIGTFLTDP
jgi:hypothetical protein